MSNPFIYGKIATGDMFTDREEEQQRLSANIASRVNSIVISPRRWGKSSLVARVATTLGAKDAITRFCFLDLFNLRGEEEFYAALAREILRVSSSRWEERIETAKRFLKRVTPKITVGADPVQDFSISFDWDEVSKSPDEILNLAEEISEDRKLKLVVCLDEFQNIAFFDDPLAFQKKLRAHWQRHQHATYCLYGSKRHMMTELFENKSKPLYKFGDVMFMEKIPETYWIPFIVSGFQRTGKNIGEHLASRIATTMENHPYFVQQLSHTVWSRTSKRCTEDTVQSSLNDLLTQHEILFQREMDGLTNPQVNFLKALCSNVEQFTASEILRTFQLGTSGNVSRIKESLVRKEVIDITPQRIEFIDPLFKIWFSTIYMDQT